jgi:inhibitor of cysteine peptidase
MDVPRRQKMRGEFKLRVSLVVVLLLVTVLLVTGCGNGADAETAPKPTPGGDLEAVVLDGEDNGDSVALSPGQTLVVSLASNPTTGYSWEVAECDEAVVKQVGEVEYAQAAAKDEQLVGAGGTETFRFEATGSGQTTLTLVYQRPWEQGVEPLEVFSVEVVVG